MLQYADEYNNDSANDPSQMEGDVNYITPIVVANMTLLSSVPLWNPFNLVLPGIDEGLHPGELISETGRLYGCFIFIDRCLE